jgi:capsular exopolysaccharide synthesis family protein
MTTLPQTTGIRLPRPVGAAPPALSGQAGGLAQSHGGGAAASLGMTPADIWRVLRANAWLLAGLFVFALVAGYGMNWYLLRNHARYTATAFVQVEPRVSNKLLNKGSADEYQDWSGLQIQQRTQAAYLTSEGLISMVLSDANSPIRSTEWFKQFIVGNVPNVAAAKADLLDRFNASPITDSQVIRVEMSTPNPTDARTIVETVVNKHLENVQQQRSNQVLDRTTALNNLKIKFETKIRELQDRQNNRMMQLNIGAIGTPGRYTATDVELQTLLNKQIEMNANAAAMQAQYENILQQIQNGIDPPTVEEMVEQNPTVAGYKNQIVAYDIEIRAATTQGKDSRTIHEMQIRRDAYQEEMDKLRIERRVSVRNALLSQMQQAAAGAKEQVDTAQKKIDQLKGYLGDLAIAMSDYLTIGDELTNSRSSLQDVRDQLDSISSNTAQSPVTWAQRPVTPDTPSFPKLLWVESIAIVLALGIGLAIAFLREVMDTSIRSPRDIQRVGQMNLLGMIPHEDDDPQSAGVPLPLVIFQAPTSIMAEQYRQVRTRLQHAASLDATRSIVVTSPAPGDGKTTVAVNLAAGLALNGRKILLVDANFRRPDVNRSFNVPNDVGFSNALASLENFEGAIRSTQVPNLDIMATGPRPANATELMESQLFTDFIERALEEYDHVIFDTAPMLLVAETAAMAPRVDGVVSVVKAATNSRGLLQRLRDSLRQIKAEHLGVVLNGVKAQGGGYYGRNIRTYYEYQQTNGEAA